MKPCVKRIYEPAASDEGHRVLVDRIWPRGVSKEDAGLDLWCKEVAPSTELRKWYGHDPARFEEFRRRYTAELRTGPQADALADLSSRLRAGPLTLLTATKDLEISAAAVLAGVLGRR